jgi:hemolysin III
MKLTTAQYSPTEEMINTLTHGFGVILSVIGFFLLLLDPIAADDPVRMVSYCIYGLSLFLLFLSSTIYHGVKQPNLKKRFKLCDHCAIYLLIAGTYTPLMLNAVDNKFGYIMLAFIWLLAFAGITFKLIFHHKYKLFSVVTYLGMGLISLTFINYLMVALTTKGLLWLMIGGIFYSVGTIFYVIKRIPFNHAIWHIFVLAGAISHFIMVWHHL